MSLRVRLRHPLLPVGMEVEVDLVDRALVAVAVDEEQARSADALDRRNVQLAVADLHLDIGGAELERALMRGLGVLEPEGHRAGARTMVPGILLGIAARLGIDDEVAVALLVQRDVLALVPGDLGEAHLGEERAQKLDVGRGIFDELEPVGAHGVFEAQRTLLGDLRCH